MEQHMLGVVRVRESAPQGEGAFDPEAGLKRCDVCGQVFVLSDLDHVFHHDGHPHAPLSESAAD